MCVRIAGCSENNGGTNSTPTIADNKTTDGSGTGSFTSAIAGLNPGTTYYVRAYATNSVGTAYGTSVSFSTAGARILSVYYGVDRIPPQGNNFCGDLVIVGLYAVPVTFSVQLDSASLALEDFAVETDTGEFVTPDCATLEPATEPLERITARNLPKT